MDEQLLNELYGAASGDQAASIQDAQAELVEAVANEAGIDLDTLSDDELDKFASYVLSEDDDAANIDPSLAEADHMGRVMAHAYVDEQEKIASAHEGDTMIDHALEKQAHLWEMQKIAANKKQQQNVREVSGFASGVRTGLKNITGYRDIQDARMIGDRLTRLAGEDGFSAQKQRMMRSQFEALSPKEQKALMERFQYGGGGRAGRMQQLKAIRGASMSKNPNLAELEALRRYKNQRYMIGGAKALGTAGVIGAAGYGGYRLMKKSSYDPSVAWIEDLDGYEFAQLAEQRAAEILLANGVDPQTFEEVYPEHVKIASFPEPEDAYSEEAAFEIDEYNAVLDDAAFDILEDLGLL